MTEPGKFAPGLRGFPTPNSVPGSSGYTVFRFPADPAWGQLILGAAQALAYAYNWYQAGDLTPDEAADLFRQIIEQAPYETCGCDNPAGGKIIRIGIGGHIQELGEDGTWQEPSGDYTVPPVTPREGGTPQDQICLAAANATNVLQQLYENLTDSWNAELSEAEALTALVLLIVALIGAAFAPITFAIVTFFGWFFGVLYETLEFVGADLWDENFTNALICILVGCAANDDGVITFDWDCFNNKLAAQTDAFDLTVSQLRLFGQIQFMLNAIGGVDALNVAGATTAITSADCSDCDCPRAGCFEWDWAAAGDMQGWGLVVGSFDENPSPPFHFRMSCIGPVGSDAVLTLAIGFPDGGSCPISHFEMTATVAGVATDWVVYGVIDDVGTLVEIASGTQGVGYDVTFGSDVANDVYYGIRVEFLTPEGCGAGDVYLYSASMYSDDLCGISQEPNC